MKKLLSFQSSYRFLVIVAASLTYNVDKECPNTFALKKETPRTDGHGFNKGLWAVSARTSG